MNDRELLELAAKAAGIALRLTAVKPLPPRTDDGFIGYMTKAEQWPRGWFNPITDDGDALRLATKLLIDLENEDGHTIHAITPDLTAFTEPLRNDASKAARRAIVRAAAEIGKRSNAVLTGRGPIVVGLNVTRPRRSG